MGLTYYSCKNESDRFDVNISAAGLLGGVHHAFDLPLSNTKYGPPYRVPYSMKSKACQSVAKLLNAKTDDEIKSVISSEHLEFQCGGDLDYFVEWIREWEHFLERCGGYKS